MNADAKKCRAACGRGLAAVMAIGFAVSAADAMEAQVPTQDAHYAASSLPSFLDVDRLPDLQQAWRNRFNAAPAADAVIPSQPAGNAGAASTSASSSSRSRAEELSHRFAFDGDADPQPTATPPAAASGYVSQQAVPVAPAATAAIDQAATPAGPAVQHVLSPIDLEPIEEPVTSAIAADADGADAESDPIARVLDDAAPQSSVAAAPVMPASPVTTEAAPLKRAVNIERPVRKVLPETAAKTRVLDKKTDADDAAKVAVQKRGEKRVPAPPAVAARKAPAAPKQFATSKQSGPLYYFNNSSSSSATAPDRHVLMPSEIRSRGWGD